MKALRALACGFALVACQNPSAKSDSNFNTSVENPAYSANGPTVLYDEGHHNIHKANRTYAPFARLIENDGYQVRRTRKKVSRQALDGVDIFVIVNALGTNERNDDLAFSDAECDTLVDWVRGGGTLLLITDHYPTGSAVANLAQRLGIAMSGGVTEDSAS